MGRPAWKEAEETLFRESREIIRRFAAEHPDEMFALLAFTVDCEYSGLALNFDTLENSVASAQERQDDIVELRNRFFAEPAAWESAPYYVNNFLNRVSECNLVGPFAYEPVGVVDLPAWEQYFRSSEETPQMAGRVIVALWRVTERLVESGVFDRLNLASPFRIAYAFHDCETVVLRILNWSTGPVETEL
jgi:hypothetical protein